MILLSLILDNKYKIINLLTCKAASIQNSLHKKYAPNPSSKAEVPPFHIQTLSDKPAAQSSLKTIESDHAPTSKKLKTASKQSLSMTREIILSTPPLPTSPKAGAPTSTISHQPSTQAWEP